LQIQQLRSSGPWVIDFAAYAPDAQPDSGCFSYAILMYATPTFLVADSETDELAKILEFGN